MIMLCKLKIQRQKAHYKTNQLCDYATVNPKVNSVINGKTCLILRVRTASTSSLLSLCLSKCRSRSPGYRHDVAQKFWASVIPDKPHHCTKFPSRCQINMKFSISSIHMVSPHFCATVVMIILISDYPSFSWSDWKERSQLE